LSLLNGALPLLAALIVLATIPRSTRKIVVLHYRLRKAYKASTSSVCEGLPAMLPGSQILDRNSQSQNTLFGAEKHETF